MLDNLLFAEHIHSSILLSGSYPKSLLILFIINHLLIRWIISHQLITRSERLLIPRIIEGVIVHVGPTRLDLIIILVVEGCFSALLRGISMLRLFEEIIVRFLELIPVLGCLLEMSYPVFKMSLFLDELLNLNKRIFAGILFKNSKSFPKILILLR